MGNKKNSQYFTVGNSINFKYWKLRNSKLIHAEGTKGDVFCKDAYYMWRCLKVCIEEDNYPILNADYLMNISMDDLKCIFKSDEGKDILPLMEERLINWRDLGKILVKKYKGQFYNLLLLANDSINRFINLSRDFRAFDDSLCKLTMVNAIFLEGRDIVNFKGKIFPAIDYHLMTQSLRIGLIKVKNILKNKIENKILISNEESLALRTATLKCLIELADRVGITGDIIDNVFFLNGRDNCTYYLNCQYKYGLCIFERICKKNIKYNMPLEITRYY